MKFFAEPSIEVLKFAVEDVVTASSNGGTNSGDTGSMGDDD